MNRAKFLKAYVTQKWYKAHKDTAWYNSHKSSVNIYVGYNSCMRNLSCSIMLNSNELWTWPYR